MAKKAVTNVDKMQGLKAQVERLQAFQWILEMVQNSLDYDKVYVKDEDGNRLVDENGDYVRKAPEGPQDYDWNGEERYAQYVARTKALDELIEYVTKG